MIGSRQPPWEKPIPKPTFGYCTSCQEVPADPVYGAHGDQRCAECYFEEVLAETSDS